MDTNDQRIAIAKACGWQDIKRTEIPDYLNDLNAMHEAEKVLDEDQHHNYVIELWPWNDGWTGLAHSATASQRAEAFLKTLNLWID